MSELEKARAGVFLSLLTITLTWLLISNENGVQSSSEVVNPLALCASTHGALCEAPAEVGSEGSIAVATTIAPERVHLGEIVVTAARQPADLGHMVVAATRLPAEPLAKVQLAKAKRGSTDTKPIVVQ